MMKRRLASLAIVALLAAATSAQDRTAQRDRNYPPKFPDAKVEVYKEIGDVKLNLYVFYPEDHKPTDKRAAIVFFFGGGWKSGTPAQFHQHCKYLASRGMVAMTADYRVRSRHQTLAVSCVADGKSAIRWVRQNAARLGVDPDRVAAGGGSAGGHVAAATGTVAKFDESGEDLSVSSRPNLLVLFNPAVVLAKVGDVLPLDKTRTATLKERMGVEPREISPYHHVTKDTPPTILFHGKADTTVPYKTAELFAKVMADRGRECKLVGFDGEGHGFFNYGRGDGRAYVETVRAMDEFLTSHGFLQGKPTIRLEK